MSQKSPPTFRAVGADWFLHWSPTSLVGTDDVEDAVRAELKRAGRYANCTPVGPSVLARLSEPLAVLAVLSRVAPSLYELYIDGVDLSPLAVPEGAVS